jgi:hypothetical protein
VKLSNLLECEQKLGYTTGLYGWNADVYNYDNVNIVTGYRCFGKNVDYKIVKKFDNKAKKNIEKYGHDWDKIKKVNHKLVLKFIEFLISNEDIKKIK